MTVSATDADDAINVNNGIIAYSILSEEPKGAQTMFTMNAEKGIISVIGTGLDREVGTLLGPKGTTMAHGYSTVGCATARKGYRSLGVHLVLGCAIHGSLSLAVVVSAALSPPGAVLGTLQGPPVLLSPGVGAVPALWVGIWDIGCLCASREQRGWRRVEEQAGGAWRKGTPQSPPQP